MEDFHIAFTLGVAAGCVDRAAKAGYAGKFQLAYEAAGEAIGNLNEFRNQLEDKYQMTEGNDE